jgi:hypothetical protein
MGLADFPDAETMVNDMLNACEHPQSTVRVKFGDSHISAWQTISGPQLLDYLNSGITVRNLTIDSVTAPK